MINKQNIMSRKAKIAYFEIFTLMISMFAFSYFVYESNNISKQSEKTSEFWNAVIFIKNLVTKPIFGLASALPSECCDTTKDGARCINTDPANCVGSLHSPSSCESTSYCKLGTCYDSQEGICMENTPQTVCNANKGTWVDKPATEVPQCQLGCCVIADQAAFVPLVRCKRLANFFGVSVDYRSNINDEVQCIATAQGQDEGACVYEKDFETTCKFTTKKDCNAKDGVLNATNTTTGSGKTFYKDVLCSAEELKTNCARQTSTNCYKQQVYWFDSCGNRENVYSSDKDKSWNNGKVLSGDSICAGNDGTKKDCGNCDYLQGARCALYQPDLKGFLNIGKPSYGDYFCKKTDCIDKDGKTWKNGESWCQFDKPSGNGTDAAGARYYRDLCVDGQVLVEPCADYRNEICIQGKVNTTEGGFSAAACRVNRWQDCTSVTRKSDCENTDRRDCLWLPKVTGLTIGSSETGSSASAGSSNPTSSQSFSNPTANGGSSFANPTANVIAPITGNSIFGGSDDTSNSTKTTTNRPTGICVPNFPPGLQFWNDGDAKTICSQASLKCIVGYEKGLLSSGKTCVTNCECLTNSWAQSANRVCSALGDCGGDVNILGKFTDDGYVWKVAGKEKKFTATQINQITSAFTGKFIANILTGNVIGAITGNAMGDAFTSIPEKPIGDNNIVAPASSGASTASSAVGVAGTAVAAKDYIPGGEGFPQQFMGSNMPSAAQTPIANAPKIASSLSTPSALNGIGLANGQSVAGAFTKLPGAGAGGADLAVSKTTGDIYSWSNAGKGWVAEPGLDITKVSGYQNSLPGFEGPGKFVVMKDGSAVDLTSGTKYVSNTQGQYSAAGALGTGVTYDVNQAWLPSMLGLEKGGFASAALGALQWGAIAYGAGYLIGSLFGMDPKNTQALALAMGAAAFSYEFLASSSWFYEAVGAQYAQLAAGAIGIGIGVAIFLMMYKKSSTETVTFECMPWQAPRGGSECEKCNDPFKPCTEYRCKALGGSCDIVNAGTADVKCVSINRNDVEPPVISPNTNVLTSGYKYNPLNQNPPAAGTKIINLNDSNGCVKAFTPLKFGFNTNEPAQCKIDFNHTTKIDEMQNWFGSSNLYLYNHTEQLSLPGAKAFGNSSLILENGKDLTLFMRCRDKMNNENPAEYAIKFCVDPSPDTTAPEIKATSILTGSCVPETRDSALVNFYVNEPSDCRWSQDDKSYENMENLMLCNDELVQINALGLFSCVANLTGITRLGSSFYVRCKDQPNAENQNDRITMQQSFAFNLRGSTGLKIRDVQPNGTIYGSITPFPVELSVETAMGCDDNRAICYYSTADNDADYIKFFKTDTNDGIHTQTLNLAAGQYTYYVKCVDSGGNVAKNFTNFNVNIDAGAPMVARTYQDGNLLKIRTVRNSECVYSFDNCDFAFKDGTPMPSANTTDHVADWKQDKTYFIKCRDEFLAESSDCAVVIQPTKNFL